MAWVLVQCMLAYPHPANEAALEAQARRFDYLEAIDSLANLRRTQVYIFGGTLDRVVTSPAVNVTAQVFCRLAGRDRVTVNWYPAAHCLPTDAFGGSCSESGPSRTCCNAIETRTLQ